MEKNIYFTDYTTAAMRKIDELKKGDIIIYNCKVFVLTENPRLKKINTLYVTGLSLDSRFVYNLIKLTEIESIIKLAHSKTLKKLLTPLTNIIDENLELPKNIYLEICNEIKDITLDKYPEYLI